MKQTNNIKKAEKQIFLFCVTLLLKIKSILSQFFKLIMNIGSQNVTIMFIPHSEKKVFNFRVNVFALFSITFAVIIAAIVTVTFGFGYFSANNKYMTTKRNIEKSEIKSKEYEEMIHDIIENHGLLKTELNKLLTQLDSKYLVEFQNNQGGGASKSIENLEYFTENNMNNEKIAYNDLIKDYYYSIQAFGELNKMAKNYNKLLKDIPFGSPVQGQFIFTSGFGFRIHPISRVLDMHQGIDLAWSVGTPIVATAPGIVEKVDYMANGYGWYCKISHKLGFSTLYGHMRSQPIVGPGEKIKKGQIIGYMGATGNTTGVHVHYEVQLGGNLKDPWQFVIAY